jgi:phosphoglycerol transferase MdoB-like AlkP superfamily enzyme
MFISEPNFYYYLAFSTIPFTFAVILGLFTVYPMVKKEDAKKRVRKVIIGYYSEVVALGSLGLLVYKYVFHQITPLYISLAVALSVITLTAILGFMYAGVSFDFFNNPHKLETKRVVVGMIISVMGIVLAVILFL